jgi:hypothetical protein
VGSEQEPENPFRVEIAFRKRLSWLVSDNNGGEYGAICLQGFAEDRLGAFCYKQGTNCLPLQHIHDLMFGQAVELSVEIQLIFVLSKSTAL